MLFASKILWTIFLQRWRVDSNEPLYPLSFWTKIHVDSQGKLTSYLYAQATASAVPKCCFASKRLMDNLSSRGWKVDQSQLLYPLLVFGRKFTLNFPGKVDSQFLRSLAASAVPSVRFKIVDSFLMKSWFNPTSLPFSLDEIRYELPKNWLTNFTLRNIRMYHILN